MNSGGGKSKNADFPPITANVNCIVFFMKTVGRPRHHLASHRCNDGRHTATPRAIFDPDRCHSVIAAFDAASRAAPASTGTTRFFCPDRNYGFLVPDDPNAAGDVFCPGALEFGIGSRNGAASAGPSIYTIGLNSCGRSSSRVFSDQFNFVGLDFLNALPDAERVGSMLLPAQI